MPPSSSDCCTLFVEMAMKSAGRNRSVRISMPSRSMEGRRFSSTSSMPCVTSTVLAPSCPETSSTTPGSPMMVAPPMGGSGALTTLATSRSSTLAPLTLAMTVRPISSGSTD